MLEYKSKHQRKGCLAPGSNTQSTGQMLQVLEIHFLMIKKWANGAYGAIKLKKTIVLSCGRKAYRIGIKAAK